MLPIEQLKSALADRYEIERQIGEGGMATVFLARDVRHHRRVAVKVLKAELGAVVGPERFLAEIEVTAGLQHPHLLPLFDSGEAAGLFYYVMAFIEGETLRQRLQRERRLSVDETIRIARAIGSGLDYAHRHGVIHRDLKPENILLHDNEPLVTDFGIALAVSKAAGARITESGISLGTPQYMSPEQAAGDRQLDARSDVYSLAAVVYEMLAGDPPHSGSTVQAVIAKVLSERPQSIRLTRDTVPEHVEAAVLRALEKEPADRFSSAADFVDALAGLRPVAALTGANTAGSLRRDVPARHSRRARLAQAIPWALAVLGVGIAIATVMQKKSDSRSVTRFTVPVPAGFTMSGRFPSLAISPDGSRLAYASASRLWLRDLNRFDAQPIAGSEDAWEPFFSPDGAWLAFERNGELVKMSLAGGPLIKVADAVAGSGGATWMVDGRMVFAAGVIGNLGLWQIPEEGGEPRPLTTLDESAAETSHLWPHALPDGAVLYTSLGPSASADDARLVVVDSAGTRTVIAEGLTYGRYVGTRRSGHLLALDGSGTLLVQPFDLRERRTTGPARAVLSDVRKSDLGGSGAYAISSNGTLAYATGTELEADLLVQSDWSGKVLRRFGAPRAFSYPALSPDGRTLAVLIRTVTNDDIHLLDLATGRFDRFTFESTEDEQPVWSPDGRQIASTSAWVGAQRKVFVKTIASSDAPRLVYTAKKHIHVTSWSPDGQWLALSEWDVRSSNVLLLSLRDSTKLLPVATGAADELDAVFSPDGKWLAYNSDETGRMEVYVVSVPDLAIKTQLTRDGGRIPQWSRTGQELYFFNPTPPVRMVVARRAGQGTLEWQDPVPLFEAERTTYFAVARDGRSFFYPAPNPDAPAREIHVAVNWLDEVTRAARPTGSVPLP